MCALLWSDPIVIRVPFDGRSLVSSSCQVEEFISQVRRISSDCSIAWLYAFKLRFETRTILVAFYRIPLISGHLTAFQRLIKLRGCDPSMCSSKTQDPEISINSLPRPTILIHSYGFLISVQVNKMWDMTCTSTLYTLRQCICNMGYCESSTFPEFVA